MGKTVQASVYLFWQNRQVVYHDMTDAPKPDTTYIDKLKSMLRARDGKAGYEKNCEEIRAKIAKLEGTAT